MTAKTHIQINPLKAAAQTQYETHYDIGQATAGPPAVKQLHVRIPLLHVGSPISTCITWNAIYIQCVFINNSNNE